MTNGKDERKEGGAEQRNGNVISVRLFRLSVLQSVRLCRLLVLQFVLPVCFFPPALPLVFSRLPAPPPGQDTSPRLVTRQVLPNGLMGTLGAGLAPPVACGPGPVHGYMGPSETDIRWEPIESMRNI